MSENLRRYTRALYTLDAVARRVPDDAWDEPSCCEGWTAREVAGHATWVIRNVGALTGANPAPEPMAESAVAGDDPAGTIAEAVQATLAGLDQQGILQRVEATPFGEMAVDDFIGVLWVDPLTHAWDLADAVGIDHGIDAATARAAHASLQAIDAAIRGRGRFADAIEIDTDDPVAQFVAFAGRTPVR